MKRDISGNKNPMFGKTSPLKGKKWEDFRTPEGIISGRKKLENGLFSGHNHKEESKLKIGEAVSGKLNGFFGKKHSSKTKTIIREKTLNQYVNGNTVNYNTKIEKKIEEILISLGIKYVKQKRFAYWVFDFYLPEQNLIIECDGDYWHANPKFYKNKKLNETQKKNIGNDKRKELYLKKKSVLLLRFWEDDIKNDVDKVVREIKGQALDKVFLE